MNNSQLIQPLAVDSSELLGYYYFLCICFRAVVGWEVHELKSSFGGHRFVSPLCPQ